MRIVATAIFAVIPLIFSSISCGADFAKGQEAFDIGDYEAAIAEWQPLAEEGDADGQFGMGLLFANGFGVPFDNDQALIWYQSAAENSHAQAQCNLAVMHDNGWGVPQSDEDAFKWYSLAAEQGVTQAQLSVGKKYSRGYGVAKDTVQAYKWLAIAAELGDSGARFKRDELTSKMSPEEITEGDGFAQEWVGNHQDLQAKD